MREFLVKLPVFQLEAGKRGLMVSARVLPNGTESDVTLFCDDGRAVGVRMPAARVLHAAKNGPFVTLAEIRGGGDLTSTAGILGPDGQPLPPV